ncbi:hypothetical protein MTO96_000048 [Rhipicephalus appendiculatus]
MTAQARGAQEPRSVVTGLPQGRECTHACLPRVRAYGCSRKLQPRWVHSADRVAPEPPGPKPDRPSRDDSLFQAQSRSGHRITLDIHVTCTHSNHWWFPSLVQCLGQCTLRGSGVRERRLHACCSCARAPWVLIQRWNSSFRKVRNEPGTVPPPACCRRSSLHQHAPLAGVASLAAKECPATTACLPPPPPGSTASQAVREITAAASRREHLRTRLPADVGCYETVLSDRDRREASGGEHRGFCSPAAPGFKDGAAAGLFCIGPAARAAEASRTARKRALRRSVGGANPGVVRKSLASRRLIAAQPDVEA